MAVKQVCLRRGVTARKEVSPAGSLGAEAASQGRASRRSQVDSGEASGCLETRVGPGVCVCGGGGRERGTLRLDPNFYLLSF